jgi:pimeloyl-ACP methyl ester carboxylesterase
MRNGRFAQPPRDVDALVGNREELAKIAWKETWPTENPQRLARRASNEIEHLEILMGRTKEEFTLRNLVDMSCCEAKSEEEVWERMRNVHVPLMIWYGGKDRAAEAVLQVAQTVPGASLLTYQHLGHGGADECPEIAARDCDRFFRDTEGRIL